MKKKKLHLHSLTQRARENHGFIALLNFVLLSWMCFIVVYISCTVCSDSSIPPQQCCIFFHHSNEKFIVYDGNVQNIIFIVFLFQQETRQTITRVTHQRKRERKHLLLYIAFSTLFPNALWTKMWKTNNFATATNEPSNKTVAIERVEDLDLNIWHTVNDHIINNWQCLEKKNIFLNS